MGDPLVYCEYLSRIRSIAISVQLPDKCVPQKITFKNVRTGVLHYIVNEQPSSLDIQLPEDITVRTLESQVTIADPSPLVSIRLPASPELARPTPSNLFDNPVSAMPWPAAALSKAQTAIKCIKCGERLTDSSKITNWKAMPSENWAEMMDFWHCHKPDNTDDQHSYNPAYALSKLTPYTGASLVGDCYFNFAPGDVSVKESTKSVLACPSCDYPLGSCDSKETLVLWKWNLRIESGDLPPVFPAEIFVSTTLGRLIDAHAIYTFEVANTDEDSPRVLLWIFNPDISYTTLESPAGEPGKRAFKVLYTFDKTEMVELKKTRGDVEQINFPPHIIDQLLAHLCATTSQHPTNARSFGKWTVGVLDKL